MQLQRGNKNECVEWATTCGGFRRIHLHPWGKQNKGSMDSRATPVGPQKAPIVSPLPCAPPHALSPCSRAHWATPWSWFPLRLQSLSLSSSPFKAYVLLRYIYLPLSFYFLVRFLFLSASLLAFRERERERGCRCSPGAWNRWGLRCCCGAGEHGWASKTRWERKRHVCLSRHRRGKKKPQGTASICISVAATGRHCSLPKAKANEQLQLQRCLPFRPRTN